MSENKHLNNLPTFTDFKDLPTQLMRYYVLRVLSRKMKRKDLEEETGTGYQPDIWRFSIFVSSTFVSSLLNLFIDG